MSFATGLLTWAAKLAYAPIHLAVMASWGKCIYIPVPILEIPTVIY